MNLPLSSYFDPKVLLQEQKNFGLGSYIGTRIHVPNDGDYSVSAAQKKAYFLHNQSGHIHCTSNVCLHRQATILQNSGTLLDTADRRLAVCPIHNWSYGISKSGDAQLFGAPKIEIEKLQPSSTQSLSINQGEGSQAKPACSLKLKNLPIQEILGGYIFTEAPDLSALSQFTSLNLSGYVHTQTIEHLCPYNWKTFLEVYLDDYHVDPYHPGLSTMVDCSQLQWTHGSWGSIQEVKTQTRIPEKLYDIASESISSSAYTKWHSELNKYYGENWRNRHATGAIWALIYPFTMIEWYPDVLVVSHLIPKSPSLTLNLVEFYHPEEIASFEPQIVASQIEAYMATVAEDDEIARLIEEGRSALYAQNLEAPGYYHSPMEDGMRYFHQWYLNAMKTT